MFHLSSPVILYFCTFANSSGLCLSIECIDIVLSKSLMTLIALIDLVVLEVRYLAV